MPKKDDETNYLSRFKCHKAKISQKLSVKKKKNNPHPLLRSLKLRGVCAFSMRSNCMSIYIVQLDWIQTLISSPFFRQTFWIGIRLHATAFRSRKSAVDCILALRVVTQPLHDVHNGLLAVSCLYVSPQSFRLGELRCILENSSRWYSSPKL